MGRLARGPLGQTLCVILLAVLLLLPRDLPFSESWSKKGLELLRAPQTPAVDRTSLCGGGAGYVQRRAARADNLERACPKTVRHAGKAAVIEGTSTLDATRTLRTLNLFLSNQYRPAFQGTLISWKLEAQPGDAARIRATLTIEPTKQNVQGRWAESEAAAKADAAVLAMDERKGALRASTRAVLGETLQTLLKRPLVADDLEVLTEQASAPKKGFVTRMRLFPAVQGTGEDSIPEKTFEGEGSSKQDSVQGAASAALTYLLSTLACAPLVGIVLRLAGGRGSGPPVGIKTLRFWNAGSSEQEDELKRRFEDFGELIDSDFQRKDDGTSEGRGTVTFATHLSAFAALRRLRGERVGDGRLLCLNVDKPKEREFKHFRIQGSGDKKGKRVQETRVFFKNAALDLTPDIILDEFEKVGPVASLWYWRQKKTGRFRGMGTVGYVDPEDAQKAMETLAGTSILDSGSPLVLSEYASGSDA